MIKSAFFAAISLWLFQAPAVPASQLREQGALEGVVMRADTGEPVVGAQVHLGATIHNDASRIVTTDAGGNFSFTNLSADTYGIFVTADRFSRQSYGQRTPNSPGIPIALSADQKLKNLDIRLMLTGAITGRILDENGQAAVGVPIRILEPTRDPQGHYRSSIETKSDDRGEYRLFGIPSGRYYLSVGREFPVPILPTTSGASNQTSSIDYAFQFYPGVADLNQAIQPEVDGGSEITIDMEVKRRQGYRVHGIVIDSSTGKPPASANMKLYFPALLSGNGEGSPPRDYDAATGRFEMRNVPSGSYILEVHHQIMDDAAIAAGEAAWAVFPTARKPIVVNDKDLEDVAMVLTRPTPVSGRIHIEGQTSGVSARIYLAPTVIDIGRMPPTTVAAADGTFEVIGLVEGEYLVHAQDFPEGLYIKKIVYDGADVLNQPLRFSGSGPGTIDIVLARGMAQLSGVITDARSQAVKGGQVVLLPDDRRRTDLYRIVTADQNGRFSFSGYLGVTPGDYKIFSWETIGFFTHFDPEFIKPFEQQGKRIHVAESSNDTVDVRVIPIP